MNSPALLKQAVGHGHAVGGLVLVPLLLLPAEPVHSTAHGCYHKQGETTWNVSFKEWFVKSPIIAMKCLTFFPA